MTIGSRRYPSDFVERRIRELQGEKAALVFDMSLYAAKGMENFNPKLFRVLVGNETVQSKVLADDERAPEGMQVIKRIMDQVSYEMIPGQKNELHMVKRISR
jgi:hypothetical protein